MVGNEKGELARQDLTGHHMGFGYYLSVMGRDHYSI